MFCPSCGETNKRSAKTCIKCGYTMPVTAAGPDGLTGILPTNTSGWAIAAGYFGLFSLIGIGGPPALICGIVALRHLRANPDLRGKVRAWIGIVLGSLGTVGLAAGIIAALVSRGH